ncbi:MAG: hypothetical protein J6P58_00905 [Oscillospiraceae bacterium]|nr:hypothetical protein [Oscillospiraceae bacterium]
MAQRTIHYVLGELLLRECPVRDRKRFLLGSILPDAYSEHEERKLAHFTNRSTPGIMFFDFDAFRRRFGDRMATDELYLGYYIHLVEDNFFRSFFRERLGVGIDALEPEEVERLHRDYTLLNAYIVERYSIRNEIERPRDFENEPLNAIAHFDLDRFLRDFSADFTRQAEGDTRYLTEPMLDEFLARCLPQVLRELRTVQAGGRGLVARDMAWTVP